jgi:hypothetical protein
MKKKFAQKLFQLHGEINIRWIEYTVYLHVKKSHEKVGELWVLGDIIGIGLLVEKGPIYSN